jgi:S-formylglutathione hydrolase FrmB
VLVLEPQSTWLFILLVAAFTGLMFWMVMTRRTLLRVLCAVVAFAIAMQVGILAVNKYFDYYPTWGAAVSDLTGPAPTAVQISESNLVAGVGDKSIPKPPDPAIAQQQGFTFEAALAGRLSHITRDGYIYLPPQWYQSAYSHYQFPVIELVHGQPGEPRDWIDVVGITAMLDQLVDQGLAKPVVLVMPDANGGQSYSSQCLNVANGGPQDMTYLGVDVPNDVISLLKGRVQPVGLTWGIAGFSEGGYCAANMALNLRRTYGFAGVLSGYFAPLPIDKLTNGKVVDPFASKRQREENTPLDEVRNLTPGEYVPQFWVGAGAGDRADVVGAEYFLELLGLHQAIQQVHLAPGAHTMEVWRAQIPPMLEWMTTNMAAIAARPHRAAVPVARHSALPCFHKRPQDRLLVSRTPRHDRDDARAATHPGFRPIQHATCPRSAPRH